MEKMAAPIDKSVKYAVIAEFTQSNFLKRNFRLFFFCKLVQCQLLVSDVSIVL